MGELKWFIGGIIVLWILWVISDGPTRLENRTRPFIEEPAPISNGNTYTLKQLQDSTRP